MHMGLKELAGFFAEHHEADSLVVATVTGTGGSTYRKPGAMMLIEPGGDFAGLISGGCLEADLVQQAGPVFADGRPRRLTYDLHDEAGEVFSLGLGCGGDIHLLLQRVDRDDGFGFLAPVFDAVAKRRTAWLALALDDPLLGEACVLDATGSVNGSATLRPALEEVSSALKQGARVGQSEVLVDGEPVRAVVVRIDPPPRILICGGGPDALPLAVQVAALGWDGTVTDQRPAFVEPGRYPPGIETRLARPEQLRDSMDLEGFDAAVVMSHHLGHDASYLCALQGVEGLRYVGLLGPAHRRRQLERELGLTEGWVHGPAGYDIGAELPAAIALSIMAEVHAVLNDRSGQPLADGR